MQSGERRSSSYSGQVRSARSRLSQLTSENREQLSSGTAPSSVETGGHSQGQSLHAALFLFRVLDNERVPRVLRVPKRNRGWRLSPPPGAISALGYRILSNRPPVLPDRCWCQLADTLDNSTQKIHKANYLKETSFR